jgi:hypothetical protein
MTPPRRGRESLREVMLRNQKSMDLLADLAGKPRVEAQGIPPAPKKRAQTGERTTKAPVPLESEIQKQIIDGLRMHPMVGLVERQNSGTAVEQNTDGSNRYIKFSTVYPVADAGDMRAVDLSVTLKDGRRFAIEVKRGDWRGPTTQREAEQENYLRHIERCGGFGMFAVSWDDVARKLDMIRRRL